MNNHVTATMDDNNKLVPVDEDMPADHVEEMDTREGE
jgi:hypothetical protein